jgi:hypothetical protein
MTAPRFMLVLTRPGAAWDLSPAELGAATGRMAQWVGALRRWRLLEAVATSAAPVPGTVRGCLVVSATNLVAARRLAASCPLDPGGAVEVLPVQEEVRAGDR